MTNVESMDYTHSHPSTIASLSSTATLAGPLNPRYIIPQNSHHTYLLWHFHGDSEIYCHATSTILFIMTHTIIVILFSYARGIHIESYFVLVSICNS